MLLVALQDDVLGLGVALERRIEDLFLDDLVNRQLALDRREQLRPRLLAALGRRLELRQELLDLVVVPLEQGDRVQKILLRRSDGGPVQRGSAVRA
jgi:hypothetical protein